jgi:DNA-binding MarR family transcriptional regulator
MNLKASTMTRFIDKLIVLQYVEWTSEGRNTFIFPTQKGKDLKPIIAKALKNLYDKYCEILGEDFAVKLTADIYQANETLRKKE